MSKLNFTSLALSILLLMAMRISQPSSARTFPNSTPNPTHQSQKNHHNNQKTITFLMRDFFNATRTTSEIIAKSSTTKKSNTNDIPFSKPLGLFPPKHAVLVPQTNTIDLPDLGLSFSPNKAYLQELELGVVTDIEEEIYDPNLGRDTYGSQLLGKARGMYVASSEDGMSHMMALKVRFGDDNDNDDDDDRDLNELRLFGVKKLELSESQESHIAVIGGVGKYQGANGYATVKTLVEKRGLQNKLLEFSVYLS